jgi:hypothetical protein
VSDAQFTLLLTAIAAGAGTIAATLRWAINRVTTAIDEARQALIKNAGDSSAHAEALRHLADDVRDIAEWCNEHTNVNATGLKPKKPDRKPPPDSDAPPPPKRRTPPIGLPIIERGPRGRTQDDR